MLRYLETDRTDVEMLPRDDCFALLGGSRVGRIGLSLHGLPAVVPVTFSLRNERIVIDTRQDAKLSAAIRGQVVAFEVDDFDAADDAGWSVAVTGRGCEAPGEYA